jgi:hypothetical protein
MGCMGRLPMALMGLLPSGAGMNQLKTFSCEFYMLVLTQGFNL